MPELPKRKKANFYKPRPSTELLKKIDLMRLKLRMKRDELLTYSQVHEEQRQVLSSITSESPNIRRVVLNALERLDEKHNTSLAIQFAELMRKDPDLEVRKASERILQKKN